MTKKFHFKLEIDCTQEQWNEIIRTLHQTGIVTAKDTYQMSEIKE